MPYLVSEGLFQRRNSASFPPSPRHPAQRLRELLSEPRDLLLLQLYHGSQPRTPRGRPRSSPSRPGGSAARSSLTRCRAVGAVLRRAAAVAVRQDGDDASPDFLGRSRQQRAEAGVYP